MKNKTVKPEINKIIKLIENSFDGKPWHGQSIMDTLNGVTQEMSLVKFKNSHSICELVAHLATWRNFVAKRLRGENQHEVADDDNFRHPKSLEDALAQLKDSQVTLIESLEQFDEEQLFSTVPTRKYDFYAMLHGVAQHDAYHAGQIALLKK
jgi:uncharacterized damage-inducible protein DinB